MVGLRVQKRVSKRVQRCDQTAMNPKDLPQAWREEAEHLRQLGAEGQACTAAEDLIARSSQYSFAGGPP